MYVPTVKSHRMRAAAALGAAGITVLTGISLARAQGSGAPLVIRGQVANPATFSLTGLHSAEDLEHLDLLRKKRFEACMTERGFSQKRSGAEMASEYDAAYAAAAIGDDATLTRPPAAALKVKLPDGSSHPVNTSWTPDTCMYKSYESLGSDPFLREVMRRELAVLRSKADQATIAGIEFKAAFGQWSSCVGRPVDPHALLSAIDPPTTSSKPTADAGHRSCVTSEVSDRARRARAKEHYEAAQTRPEIVSAWVSLVDAELASAG